MSETPSTGTKTHRPQRIFKGSWLRLFGTLLSSALFVWLLARQDWAATWQHLMSIPLWLALLVFLLYFTGMLLNTWRWRALLRTQGIRLPFVEALKIMLSGAFASNFLPSTIGGDAVRVVSLLRFRATLTLSMASVVMDRLLNVLATFTMLPFSLTVFPFQFGLKGLVNLLARFRAEPFSLALAGAFFPAGWLKKPVAKLHGWLIRLQGILRTWLSHPGTLLLLFVLSWLSTFVVYLAIWVLASALGMSVSLMQVIGVMAITYLVSLLPISLNGYGVREITLATLYMQIGATLEQASTLAVVTRFLLLLEALPGALWLSDALEVMRQKKVNGERAT